MGFDADLVHETGALLELGVVGLAHDVAAFHGPVFLHVREEHAGAGVRQGRARDHIRLGHRPQRISAEAGTLAHMARRGPAVAERDDQGVIRKTRLDMHGTADFAAADAEFEHRSVLLAHRELSLLLTRHLDRGALRLDAELLAELGTDEDRVVPRNLRDRIRALLQPAVVGETTVVQRVVRHKTNLKVLEAEHRRRCGGSEQAFHAGPIQPHVDGLVRGTREQTVVQEARHDLVRRAAAGQRSHRRRHLLVRIGLRVAQDAGEHFNFRQPAEERQNHRLNRQDRPVEGAGIAPRFEVVRRREMGRRGRVHARGFVDVVAEANDLAHGLLQRDPIKIGRGIVRGIAAENDECLDRTALDRGRETAERGGTRLFRRHELDRLAHVA